jgi:hypothetical protein
MLHDGLGSVRGVFDGDAAERGRVRSVWRADCSAYRGPPTGFTGELTDGNGLVYLRARVSGGFARHVRQSRSVAGEPCVRAADVERLRLGRGECGPNRVDGEWDVRWQSV